MVLGAGGSWRCLGHGQGHTEIGKCVSSAGRNSRSWLYRVKLSKGGC